MSILQSWNLSFSWKQCVVLRHLDSSRTLQLTKNIFPPFFVFGGLGQLQGMCFQLQGLFLQHYGWSLVHTDLRRSSLHRRILPTIPVEQMNWISNSSGTHSISPSISISPFRTPRSCEKRNNVNVGNSFNVWSFVSERTGCNLGVWILLPQKNGPNLLNKKAMETQMHSKYNQGTAWKTRKTPALQLLRMAHTSQDGQHFILPNLRRRFFHTKKLWYWQMPFHSWAQTCLFKFSGGRPPFSYSTYSNESQYLCQNGTSN